MTVAFEALWRQGGLSATSHPRRIFLVMSRVSLFAFVCILPRGYRSDRLSSFNSSRTHLVPKEYNGKLNFAMDSWLSPNHKAYFAITVHFKWDGGPFSMLLDLVEVAKLHTGVNLGIAFTNVLKNFGIEEKVSNLNSDQRRTGDHSPVTWTCVTFADS